MKINSIKTLVLAMTFLLVGIASCTQKSKEQAHGHEHNEEAAHEHEEEGHGHDHSEGHGHDDDSNHEGEDSDGISFKDSNLKSAFEQYALLRNALTDTDFDKTKSNALILMSVIKKVNGAEKVTEAVEIISKSANIEAQRLAFSDLSNELLALIKGNLSSGELYLAYCPMALDNAGANWITEVNEIKNPYFGDKMLKCGTIKETLN